MTTDTERLNTVARYIEARLDYLARLTYNHEANIAQPNTDEQFDYLTALGEMRALQGVTRVMMGLGEGS